MVFRANNVMPNPDIDEHQRLRGCCFETLCCLSKTLYPLLIVQGSHRPGKFLEFDLGHGKILEFEKSSFLPGIVLESCKTILEYNMNYSFLSPDPKRIGGYSDQPGVRPSVRLSVCPSVCPSVDKSLCAQ